MLHSATTRIVSDSLSSNQQRCRVPFGLMKASDLKPNDVISINCGEYSYICRISPLAMTELDVYISIDDTVSFTPETKPFMDKNKRMIFHNNCKVVKPITFEKVQVKVVLKNEKFLDGIDTYSSVVFKLLGNYVIKKKCTVKCKSSTLATMINIHSIIISETFQDAEAFGRLAGKAVVEIVEMISLEQLNLLKKFGNASIGGIKEPANTLSKLLQKSRVIVSGPSGCGKSLFVKKFCNDLNCSLVVIDGLNNGALTMEKCDMYVKQLIDSVKMFPSHPTILVIDHIDELASTNVKQRNEKFIAALVYLCKHLESSTVGIILVTTQLKLIHPFVSRLFKDEVFLGIPSSSQRKEMLKVLTKPFPKNHIEYDKIAAMTPGFLACDIAKIGQLLQDSASDKKKTTSECQTSIKNGHLNTHDFAKTLDSNSGCLSTHDFENAVVSITPTLLQASNWNMKVKPVCWEDIGGMDDIKKKLQLSIETPLRHPEIFQKVDLRCPRGVLLFGPPGCCKTTLARGLATECNANFFAANPSQIYSSYVGDSEKNISQLFYQARLCAPSIIFLDEVDSLVGCRKLDTKQQGVSEKILSTLLSEMDGLGVKRSFGESYSSNKTENLEGDVVGTMNLQDEVIVIGATNRPDYIDDALLRPGRFDIIMYVPPPNLEERISILLTITKKTPLHEEVDLRKIAEKTNYFTGADLKNVCNMATMNCLRKHLLNAEEVSQNNFMQALEKAQPSVTKAQIEMYEKLSNKFGPIVSNK